jgi:sortase (surface protein transpeptidase)
MIQDEQHGRRPRRIAVIVAALLVLAGAAAIVVALTSQQHAPQPPAAAARSTSAPSAAGIPGAPPPSAAGTTKAPVTPAPAVAPLPAADPVHLEIPALKVSSDLLTLGLNPDGTLEVPPLAKDSRAGWYRGSPAPGALGPAVLLGHVDSAEYGPGIFFRLGALRPGDTVTVTRADSMAATFRVDRVASYPKARFPTLEVYGNTDDSQLRLITCGGDFDAAARSYLNNIVVYASLVSTTRV